MQGKNRGIVQKNRENFAETGDSGRKKFGLCQAAGIFPIPALLFPAYAL